MIHDFHETAAALYDGGWRPEDREQMIAEYNLNETDADSICTLMESFGKEELHAELDTAFNVKDIMADVYVNREVFDSCEEAMDALHEDVIEYMKEHHPDADESTIEEADLHVNIAYGSFVVCVWDNYKTE